MSKKISIKNPKSKSPTAEDWVLKREGIKRLTFDVPISLHSKLKIASVKYGQTMGDIVRSCIEKYLSEVD